MNSSKTPEARRLTTDGKLKTDPVFLPDGTAVIYGMQEKPIQLSLMRLTLAGSSIERHHPLAQTSEFEYGIAPGGRPCAFVQLKGNLKLNLVVRDLQQAKDATYSPEGGFAGVRRPTLAPDGSRVAFALPVEGGQEIATLNAQCQELRRLTNGAFNAGPAFAPDGKHIAFASSRAGGYNLYLMNADGGEVRQLTHGPGMSIRPAWSPDGRRIAFTTNRHGNFQIYAMKADGTDLRRATQSPERDDYPAWHPDGKQLVFVGERAGKSDLFLVEVPE
jgi:TolB protein